MPCLNRKIIFLNNVFSLISQGMRSHNAVKGGFFVCVFGFFFTFSFPKHQHNTQINFIKIRKGASLRNTLSVNIMNVDFSKTFAKVLLKHFL